MKCKKIERKIIDFIEGNLNFEEKKKIEEHLKICENCNSLYRDFLFILTHSKKIEVGKINESLLKERIISGIERKKIHLVSLKPVYVFLSLFVLITFSFFFTKIYSKKTISISKSQIEPVDYELLFSEDEIIKYADYMDEKEIEKVLDFIFEQ